MRHFDLPFAKQVGLEQPRCSKGNRLERLKSGAFRSRVKTTSLLVITCWTMLVLSSCSRRPSSAGGLPFEPPHGWERDAKMTLFTVYKKAGEPSQSFRYFRLHLHGAGQLTPQTIATKLQAMGMETASLEKLSNGNYYGEETGASNGPEGSLSRRNFYFVQRESSTEAIAHCVVFFCPPSAVENAKSTQEYIRKQLREGHISG